MVFRFISLLSASCLLIAACASDSTADATTAPATAEAAIPGVASPADANEVFRPATAAESSKNKTAKSDRVTIEASVETLGNLVRAVGEQAGGNVVLMSGVESRVLTGIDIKRRSVADSVAILAAGGGLTVNENAEYFFLFPDGYEQLLSVSLAGRLDARYANVTTDAAFGSGLPLFSVFMWMGYALDMTIIGDHSISDAHSGELALKQVSLETALEAVLKSARVVSLATDSTPEFIFLAAPANKNPSSLLLEEASLTDAQRDVLDKQVSLALPRPLRTGQRMEMSMQPSKLGDILPTLSEQLGITVVAEKGLLEFPVNPFYVHKARLGTAMDLLLRQWLEANYGYQLVKDRIVIRRK
ncbi:MAG: hypothetical protein SGI88_11450 [Candidatus Hydrogenedentes bacterium]|nr:hypothetical protein [Candidatus Hydrogenedentota bacterium]